MRARTIFIILGTAFYGAAACRAERKADAIIEVPGIVQKKPPEYPQSMDLFGNLTAPTINLEVPGGTDKSVGVYIHDGKPNSAHETWYKLTNPLDFSAIVTPIPLNIAVQIDNHTKRHEAVLLSARPNSVAIWQRIRDWDDVKKALPATCRDQIDAAAAKVESNFNEVFEQHHIKQTLIVESYEVYADSICNAILAFPPKSYLGRRWLALLLTGARDERLAWIAAREMNLKLTGLPGPASDNKATTEIEKGVWNANSRVIYEGYERLQLEEPPITYKYLYQESRACVAVSQKGNPLSATSGMIIGDNLILTCAHGVTRQSREGAQITEKDLVVRIGDDFPEDKNTPYQEIPARLIHLDKIAPTERHPTLDYAILWADISRYQRDQLDRARNRDAELARAATGPEDQLALANKRRDTAYWPITPIPLGNFDVDENREFNLVGFPGGGHKKVCTRGSVMYPFKLDERNWKEHRLMFHKLQLPSDVDRMIALWGETYYPHGDFYWLSHKDKDPGIGVVCSTVPGNSGSPALVNASPDTDLQPTAIGILSTGQDPRPIPYVSSLDRHETLVPMTEIIRDLDTYFKRETKDGERFVGRWDEHYNVTIYEEEGGRVAPRHKR